MYHIWYHYYGIHCIHNMVEYVSACCNNRWRTQATQSIRRTLTLPHTQDNWCGMNVMTRMSVYNPSIWYGVSWHHSPLLCSTWHYACIVVPAHEHTSYHGYGVSSHCLCDATFCLQPQSTKQPSNSRQLLIWPFHCPFNLLYVQLFSERIQDLNTNSMILR